MLNSAENRMWLRYLTVDRIRQYQQQLEALPQSFHLALHGSVLEQDSARALITSIMKCSLNSIFLDDFQCSRSTWLAFDECLQALSMKVPRIQLQLRRISIIDEAAVESEASSDKSEMEGSDVYLARRLSELVKSLSLKDDTKSSLSELVVMDCGLTSHAAQVLLSDLCNTPTSLQLLSLEGNSIGNAGIRFVSRALGLGLDGPLAELQTLSLERVGASDDGIGVLLESIRHHKNLKCLNLMGNHTGKRNLKLFRNILENENHSLERVQWDGEKDDELDFWLRVNRKGRRFVWNYQQTDSRSSLLALWPWILEPLAKSDPPVLYYFLRSKPELCSTPPMAITKLRIPPTSL